MKRQVNACRLLTPGPVSIEASVLEAMTCCPSPADAAFISMMEDVRSRLLRVAGMRPAEYAAVLMAGPCAFALEAALTTLIPEESRVLVVCNGARAEAACRMLARADIRLHDCPHECIARQNICNGIDVKLTLQVIHPFRQIVRRLVRMIAHLFHRRRYTRRKNQPNRSQSRRFAAPPHGCGFITYVVSVDFHFRTKTFAERLRICQHIEPAPGQKKHHAGLCIGTRQCAPDSARRT